MNEVEISYWAKELEEAMKDRTRVKNRARQFEIKNKSFIESVEEREKIAKKSLKQALKNTEYEKFTKIPGVSTVTTGHLVRYTRNNKRIVKKGKYVGTKISKEPKKYPGPRSLRHHAGFHVEDGKAARKKRGEKVTWNTNFRNSLLRWANSVWRKRKGKYWDIMKKAYEESLKNPQHKDWTEAHHKNHARRIGVQELLNDFYQEYLA